MSTNKKGRVKPGPPKDTRLSQNKNMSMKSMPPKIMPMKKGNTQNGK